MKTLSVADARATLSEVVESAAATHERFEITRNGARVAMLFGATDYDSLLETLAILSDRARWKPSRWMSHSSVGAETSSRREVRDAMVRVGHVRNPEARRRSQN